MKVRQAVAQALAQSEPVAWRTFDGEGGYDYRTYENNEDYADEWDKRNSKHKGWVEPLYTTPPQQEAKDEPMHPEIKKLYEDYFDKCFRESSPPQRTWVGLTDEEISKVDWKSNETLHEFARAIEAKLKEKNT
jgi:hypothetical protein